MLQHNSDDGTAKIWNISSSLSWTLITTYSQHSSGVYALQWLVNDTLASAGQTEKTIKLWSPTTGETVPEKKNGESLKRFL